MALGVFLALVVAAIAFPAVVASTQGTAALSSQAQGAMLTGVMVGCVLFLLAQLLQAWAVFRAASLSGGEGRALALTLLAFLPTVSLGVVAIVWLDVKKRLRELS